VGRPAQRAAGPPAVTAGAARPGRTTGRCAVPALPGRGTPSRRAGGIGPAAVRPSGCGPSDEGSTSWDGNSRSSAVRFIRPRSAIASRSRPEPSARAVTAGTGPSKKTGHGPRSPTGTPPTPPEPRLPGRLEMGQRVEHRRPVEVRRKPPADVPTSSGYRPRGTSPVRRASTTRPVKGRYGRLAPFPTGELAELLQRGRVQDLDVNRPVAVHDAVAEPNRVAPGNVREACLGLTRHASAASPSTVNSRGAASLGASGRHRPLPH
jgi:hypothetical protein